MSKLCKIISILSSIVGLLAVGLGLMIKMRAKRDVMAASIAIIGGADGPTSIFVAGKVGDGSVIALLVAGGILLVLAAVLFFRHRT